AAYQVLNPDGMSGTTNTPNPNGMALGPGQFLIMGPPGKNPGDFAPDVNGTIPKFLGVGSVGSVAVPTAAMSYSVTDLNGDDVTWAINKVPITDITIGMNVLVRRLINPNMPPSVLPTSPLDPTFNPFYTVDFMEGVKINPGVAKTVYQSQGKQQPYASANIP